MAHPVVSGESNTGISVKGAAGTGICPGSKSMACMKRCSVNVGGPNGSHKEASIDRQVWTARESRRQLGSQMRRSSNEAE